MSSGNGLKVEQQILRLLASGPRSKIDIRRELGWSVWGQSQALDGILRRMRVAGLVEAGNRRRGHWQLREGVSVCPACLGRGIVHKAG